MRLIKGLYCAVNNCTLKESHYLSNLGVSAHSLTFHLLPLQVHRNRSDLGILTKRLMNYFLIECDFLSTSFVYSNWLHTLHMWQAWLEFQELLDSLRAIILDWLLIWIHLNLVFNWIAGFCSHWNVLIGGCSVV